MLTQGKIIAGAVAASAASDTDAITINPERLLELQAGESFSPADDTFSYFEFPIDPEKAAPILRAAISPTDTRARIYDLAGNMVVDSEPAHSDGVLRFNLPERRWKTPTVGEIAGIASSAGFVRQICPVQGNGQHGRA